MNTMSRRALATIAMAASMTALQSTAAELQILAGGGIAGPVNELKPRFEKATGHTLVVRFGATPELIKMATGGGPFDAAVVPREVFNDAGAKAMFVAGPTVDVARVGLGIAVKSGAAKPAIGTAADLKQALLAAHSVATVPASATGMQIQRVYDQMGIADAMKAKTKALAAPLQVVEAVARGDAELGVFLINVLLAPGLDYVGPFPSDVQQEVVFTSAVAAGSREAEAAKAFLDYLKSPEAVGVIRAKGMTPG